jgi:(R)-2-hydroxyacyl-CoA dehydratese activating ATPase
MSSPRIVAGIDAGSRMTKIVLWDVDHCTMLHHGVIEQGVQQRRIAWDLYVHLLAGKGLRANQVSRTFATGYGRALIDFADTTITEITCHARGVRQVAPEARTVIEIGGQDSKLIRLDVTHGVRDFTMNDRCAAGTGRFLEMVAVRLGISLDDLGALISESHAPASISSTCVVFAETEIIGLLANGTSGAELAAGVQLSVATRVAAMAGRGVEAPIWFTGGVALVPGMAAALGRALGQPVSTCPQPLLTGALGAALLAASAH